jgi:hypothetical protein
MMCRPARESSSQPILANLAPQILAPAAVLSKTGQLATLPVENTKTHENTRTSTKTGERLQAIENGAATAIRTSRTTRLAVGAGSGK